MFVNSLEPLVKNMRKETSFATFLTPNGAVGGRMQQKPAAAGAALPHHLEELLDAEDPSNWIEDFRAAAGNPTFTITPSRRTEEPTSNQTKQQPLLFFNTPPMVDQSTTTTLNTPTVELQTSPFFPALSTATYNAALLPPPVDDKPPAAILEGEDILADVHLDVVVGRADSLFGATAATTSSQHGDGFTFDDDSFAATNVINQPNNAAAADSGLYSFEGQTFEDVWSLIDSPDNSLACAPMAAVEGNSSAQLIQLEGGAVPDGGSAVAVANDEVQAKDEHFEPDLIEWAMNTNAIFNSADDDKMEDLSTIDSRQLFTGQPSANKNLRYAGRSVSLCIELILIFLLEMVPWAYRLDGVS